MIQQLNTLALVLGLLFLAPAGQEIHTLEPGKAVEREIAGGETHTYQISLTTGGKLTGKTVEDGTGATSEIVGSVDEDGGIEFAVKYPKETFTVKGTITRTKAGRIKGTLVQYSGKAIVGVDEIDWRPK